MQKTQLLNIALTGLMLKSAAAGDYSPDNVYSNTMKKITEFSGQPSYDFENFMKRVQYQESDFRNINQQLDNEKEGLGSGYFQFETWGDDPDRDPIETAGQRLKNVIGHNPWSRKILSGEVRRAKNLPHPIQKSLFLANIMQHPDTRLKKGFNFGHGNRTNGIPSYTVWAKGHHGLAPTTPREYRTGEHSQRYEDWINKSRLQGVVDYPALRAGVKTEPRR